MDINKFDEAERLVRCVRDIDEYLSILEGYPLWLVVRPGSREIALNRLDSYANDVVRPMLISHYKQIRKDTIKKLEKL